MLTATFVPAMPRPARDVLHLSGLDPAELLEPRDAAVRLCREFRVLARKLAPGDPSTQDDLMQEMALAALTLKRPHPRATYLRLAGWKANTYLHWWHGPMFKPSEKKKEERMATLVIDDDYLDLLCSPQNTQGGGDKTG